MQKFQANSTRYEVVVHDIITSLIRFNDALLSKRFDDLTNSMLL